MKQLTCEMCGGTDLIKQDGVFVCQSCGTKYSMEEAKKMMVEGTIKIDNSEKLRNLYTLARQAKESNDAENAVKYYDLIKQEDPTSWEACFYNVYFRAAQTRIMYIESAANSIKNCLETVFGLIKNGSDSDEEKKAHVMEVSLRVALICASLESSSKSTLVKSWSNTTNSANIALDYTSRALATADALFVCGDLIERDYEADTAMIKAACNLWGCGIYTWKTSYAIYDDHATRYSIMKNSYVAKLQKYQSDYSFTAPQYLEFPNQYSAFAEKNSNSDFGIGRSSTSMSSSSSTLNSSSTSSAPSTSSSSSTSSALNTSSSSSGGCYVATAVYGSYDCPQVWTLRRYRDYTLAETWYGRAFIHTYYAISPTLVKWFGDTEWFKRMWKGKLDRMVANLKAEGVKDTPYEDRSW